EFAFAPFLDLLFERDGLEGAGGRADGLALHVLERLDAGLLIGGDGHLEGEIGDRHADGLARSSVSEVEATPTSTRPDIRAGMRSGKGVSTISAVTPRAAARSLQ